MDPSLLSHARSLLGAGFVCAGLLASAQSNLDTIYHLHGTVIDGLTGKPVARALVTSTDRRLAVLTNGEGHFSVDLSVPPRTARQGPGPQFSAFRQIGGDELQLLAQRPEFLPDNSPTIVALDPSLNDKEVVLKLMRGGSIAGRVTADGTDSTRGVRVALLKRQVLDGTFVWTQAGSEQVNTDGAFRFVRLEPGEYSVMSAEWAGDRSADTDLIDAREQYPPVFLGDSASFGSATRLHLHFGEELGAALHLRPVPYFPVSVPVQNQPPNAPVNVRLVGRETFNGFSLGWNAREGAVTGSLPSGSYTLLISSSGPHPAALAVPLAVTNHALEHAAIALAPGTDIPVRVHLDFPASRETGTSPQELRSAGTAGRAEQPPLNLSIRPEDMAGGNGGGVMRRRDDGTIVLENAQPGRYLVRANAVRGYIASLTSGNTDLLRAPLIVSDSGFADPLDVTLRDDGATLTGTVDPGDDAPAGNTSLLLAPVDGSSQVYQGYVFANGQFTISNIAPGAYRLLAFPAGRGAQQTPFREPAAMKSYNGTAVTLTAGQSASVHIGVTGRSDPGREQ